MNIEQAKEIAIVQILERLQIFPKRKGSHKLRYSSPFRAERTPSFDVDLKTNRWIDYGEGIGGDPVDFACAYLKATREAHTVSDGLRWLKNMSAAAFIFTPIERYSGEAAPVDPTFALKSTRPIQHPGLVQYLTKRGIPMAIAHRHLNEVRVLNTHTNKKFFALGFANEEGGIELRNPFFKGCLGSKAITFIRGSKAKPARLHLYEGFMDYLSSVSQLDTQAFACDTIVLNSVSNLRQALPYLMNYDYHIVHSWFDNDQAGRKARAKLREFIETQDGLKHIPMNGVYAPHQDVNAWHMHRLGLRL